MSNQVVVLDEKVTSCVSGYHLLLDKSYSMEDSDSLVRENLENYKAELCKADEANSIVVSKAEFAEDFTSQGFVPVDKLDTSYVVNGSSTALYYAIVKSAELVYEAYETLAFEKGITPRLYLIIFSDGKDNSSFEHKMPSFTGDIQLPPKVAAIKAIKKLLKTGCITVVFTYFGYDGEKIAEELEIPSSCIKSGDDLNIIFDAIIASSVISSQAVGQVDDFFESGNPIGSDFFEF